MKIAAVMISVISAVMIVVNWDTPIAAAWTVAFAGWVPHIFKEKTYEAVLGK